MSVVLLEPTHWPPTPNNLFLHNHLDSPLEYALNSLENIFETLTTSVAYFIYKNMKYLKSNFFDRKVLLTSIYVCNPFSCQLNKPLCCYSLLK